MKILDFHVDGFGVWSGLEMDGLSDELTVFYGPNEAGKTTLMQFVRTMLYGFAPERRARYLPPVRGGRAGGTMILQSDSQAYALDRHLDDLHAADVLGLNHADGQSPGAASLPQLLGDVDEPIFNNVFAFGLREIQELATLDEAQVADELYTLALGLDRVSLVDVLNELESSRTRLLAVDDRPSLIAQLLGQRQRLQAELDELGQATTRYLSLEGERERLDLEIARLEEEKSHVDTQQRELTLARTLGDRWQRRAAIDAQLVGLGEVRPFPDDGLERLERTETRAKLIRRRKRTLKRRRRELNEQIAALRINEPLCRHAVRLEALSEQQHWISSLAGQVGSLETELLELEAEREEHQKQWGGAVRGGKSPQRQLSKRGVDELRAAAKALRRSRREAKRLHEQVAANKTQADQKLRELETGLGSVREKGLTAALAEAGELVSLLRKRVQIDERIDGLSRRETELEGQSQEHLENQVLPGWVLGGLGALFVIGCALVLLFLAGLILPASLGDSLTWPLGLVGVLAAGGAGAMKFAMEWRATSQLDTCQQQLQLLANQLHQARAERDELDEQLPRGGGPLAARLMTAEKSLAHLEELLPLQSQRELIEQEAQAAAERQQSLRDQCVQARRRWLRLLDEYGLPHDLSPRDLAQHAQGRKRLHDMGAEIEGKRADLARRRGEYEGLTGRITQLIAEIGLTPRSNRPLEQLQQCLSEVADQQNRLKQREELQRQIGRLRRRFRKLVRKDNSLRRQRRGLLRSVGAADEEDFRRKAQVHAQLVRLRAERAHLAQEIATSLAGHFTEEHLASLLASPDQSATLANQLAELQQSLAAQLGESLERRGAIGQQIQTLLDDRQLAHKRIELDQVEGRLQEAIERWRVLAVCSLMLAAVRDYYEREHQPQALREASKYLKRLTGGRYTRVWTPLGQHVLRVDDQQGHTLGVEVLSSGTREQLFLALRLALVGAYARRGIQLPLVLDDVLVNFDVTRAKAAATVLRDFARQGHQLLIFTCHEHIAKLFRALKADVRVLPDNASLATDAGKRRRRVELPEPEPMPELEPEPEEMAPVEPAPVAEAIVEEAVEEPQPVVSVVIEEPWQGPVVEEVGEFYVPEVMVEMVVPAPILPEPPEPEPEASEPAEPELIVPEPEPAPRVAPPPPKPRPAKRSERRVRVRAERVRWSAEEFDGELADRVRRTDWWYEDVPAERGDNVDDEAA